MKTLVACILMLLIPSAGLALHTDLSAAGGIAKHDEHSLRKVTEKGLFSVEMVIEGQELEIGVNSLDIILHDKDDKAVTDAQVTVTPWMPEMGHGVFEKPVVGEKGGGLYRVEDIILIMGGRWELRIKISKGDQEDSAIFDFPGVRPSEVSSPDEHRALYSSPPADVDTTTVHVSAMKLFRISYSSDTVPIPVGRFITWKLNVSTADGHPIKDAVIAINGDMPEHGHGLPTNPEVIKGKEAGDYVVRGLKFSMPGWWTITFKVKAQDADDHVTFNLVVP